MISLVYETITLALCSLGLDEHTDVFNLLGGVSLVYETESSWICPLCLHKS